MQKQKLIQNVSFGQNLKKIRTSRSLSQNDMIRELELKGRAMSRANYAHIEQGVRNVFVSDLVLFKEILDVSFDDFFEGLVSE